MFRPVLLSLASILLIPACDRSGTATEAPQTAPPPAAADDVAASPATEEPPTEAEDAAPPSPEDEEARKQAKRLEKDYAALEEWKQEEAKRWTEELEKEVAALVAKKRKGKKAITAVVGSPHRHPDNVARDEYRHPVETLRLFGLKPSMTVVEVGPGAGWYTEILAPLLATRGKLLVTAYDPKGPENDRRTLYARRLQAFLDSSDAAYGKVERIVQADPDKVDLGEPGSADMVLIIRGLHGSVRRGQFDQSIQTAHAALKPGGVLGIVQHRAKKGADPEESAKKGYLPQAWVVSEVEKAGFKLEKKSELNANPKDTADHEQGVWTLPPTLALGDEDREKYVGIGESDRMTLKFRKPK